MDIIIFLKGASVGFFLCAPLGPIGIICIRRALVGGRIMGVLSVLGASMVDALYCSIAGFGISFLSTFLVQKQVFIQVLCCIVLLALGTGIFLVPPKSNSPAHPLKGRFDAFFSTFLITLSNPMPILIFTAIFSALDINGWKLDFSATVTLVMGVFAGSAVWAPLLISGVRFFRIRSDESSISRLNRISGFLLCGFGLILGSRAFLHCFSF